MAISSGIRILTIIHGFPPLRGGGEVAAYSIAECLVELGCRVKIVTSDLQRYPAFERMDQFEIHRVASRRKTLERSTPGDLISFYWRAGKVVQKLIDEFRPDLLHAHFAIPAGLLAWRQRQREGIPYVLTCHGSDVPGFNRKRYSRLYALLTPLFRCICSQATQVVFVSKNLRDYVLGIDPQLETTVIYNGVDDTVFYPSPSSEDQKRETVKLLFVGRLIRLKGLHLLLEALPEVLRQVGNTKIRLTVVGEGEDRNRLQRLAVQCGVAQFVYFKGSLPVAALAAEYREADLFILPSLGDASPVVLAEAMASGLPVVASRVGGIPELLGDSEFLVSPGDKEQLAEKLVQLVLHQELRREVGQSNLEKSRKLRWQEIARQYLAIFHQISDAAPGPRTSLCEEGS